MSATNSQKNGYIMAARRTVVKSWDNQFAGSTYGSENRKQTPFRAVTSSGDYLVRENYVCGGSTPYYQSRPGIARMLDPLRNVCDSTGVPTTNANKGFVYRSSDYIQFKAQKELGKRYNNI